ncbi:hypothetical protein [Acidihalobacter prosperus]|uniref:Uncharacterized protein n=1 Tax=Acidihalobacter prosperus TaxID=160660 RepID=A0A1A6C7F5_9GAMM|nr:hypothetical protein [Acidihalobacter prosperus]OBS10492.1 hypothetical protein Thpro_020208 [Acidihalobacter prosperus]
MNVLILETGLFPERDILLQALTDTACPHNVRRNDLRETRNEKQWDRLLDEILTSDRVFTV